MWCSFFGLLTRSFRWAFDHDFSYSAVDLHIGSKSSYGAHDFCGFHAGVTRSSSQATLQTPFPQSPSSSIEVVASDNVCHCPFKSIHGCGDGVHGRGYVKGSFLKHLHDKHLTSKASKDIVRNLIEMDLFVYRGMENVLYKLRMWLCSKCFYLHAWSKSCKGREGAMHDFIPGPFNGEGADFLIHGLNKPDEVQTEVLEDVATVGDTFPVSDGSDVVEILSTELLNVVLQRNIPTVNCIPHKCRLAFSRALKASLDRVLASPPTLSGWLRLLLLPICTLSIYQPKSSAERKSSSRKRLQVAAILKALNDWKEPNGCSTLVNRLLQQPLRWGSKKADEEKAAEKQQASTISACQKKIKSGHFAAAIRVLTSSGVAPFEEQTYVDLLDKHPLASPPEVPLGDITSDPISVGSKAVLGAIKSFPKGTSCGRDGLCAQHLVDVLSGAAAAVADDLLLSISGVVNLWLAGKCPSELGEYIANAPLTPLLKPGGRP